MNKPTTEQIKDAKKAFAQHPVASLLTKKQCYRLRCIWLHMKDRCNNPASKAYQKYGAVGVKVLEPAWSIFENFAIWALENGYKDNLTIDRISGYCSYHAENCRWVTKAENCRNRPSYNHYLADGRLACDVARQHGIKNSTWFMRFSKGWDLLTAVTKPVNKKFKN